MPKIRSRMTASVVSAAFSLGLVAGAHAASPETADPPYQFLRYNDDFSYLADPSQSTDFWDPLKYIRLGDGQYGASYITLGGEIRERFESYKEPSFGIKAPPSNAYVLSRIQLDADIHITGYTRIFLQLGNNERIGDRGVTSTTDIDHLELFQAFVDLKLPPVINDAPIVRLGREELAFGYQRLIAVREGPNVRRDFDGVRFIDQFGDATVNVMAVRPLSNASGVFDDHTNMKQFMWGTYVTVPLGTVTKADIYELNYENTAARFRGLTGVEQRQTIGVRLFGASDGFDWNGEIALQQGTFRGKDIRADMLAGIAGYTFKDVMWTPRIGIESNYASGDSGHGTIGTFNAMYPRLPYFAETSLLVPANIYDVRPVFNFAVWPNVVTTLGYDMLWRPSTADGLYGSGMAEYVGTNKGNALRVGTEPSIDVRWHVDQHLQLGAIAAQLLAGPALVQNGGKSVSFYVAFATYRF